MAKKTKNRKTTLIWLTIMMVFIFELLFYTWCRVQCVQMKYEITKTEEKINIESAMQNKFKIELARLKSPEELIKSIARNKLGLIMPKSEQIIIIP